MKKIAIFDFDGTIIKNDSMILFFFKFFKFTIRSFPGFLKMLTGALKYFLKIDSQASFKQKYVATALKYPQTDDMDTLAEQFSDYLASRIFPEARAWIKKLKADNYELVLCSASIDLYLEKLYKKLGFDKLICTKVFLTKDKVVIEKNCYGPNKIEMILSNYENDKVDWKSSYCFTDGSSDKELLELFGNSYIINNRWLHMKNPGFNFLLWN